MKRSAGNLRSSCIAGWKKSGKTTLVTRVIAELTRRGLKVRDRQARAPRFPDRRRRKRIGPRHRRAGAVQVAVVCRATGGRWSPICKARRSPSWPRCWHGWDPCDLVIIEGYKGAAIPKTRGAPRGRLRQGAAGGEGRHGRGHRPPTTPWMAAACRCSPSMTWLACADFIAARAGR